MKFPIKQKSPILPWYTHSNKKLSFRSKFAALNSKHAYFLLVDNGTIGKYGAEIVLRRKLEKFISNQRLYPCKLSKTVTPQTASYVKHFSVTHSIPLVCLVIEGGTNTIRAVLEYVTDDPPVPVVVCDGSGRAADLIAFMHKWVQKPRNPLSQCLFSQIF